MSRVKEPVAVIHGRFQPLHIGHMEYLLAAKETCELLIIGITSPDPWLLGDEDTDVERGKPESNPCTYYERYLMLEGAMVDASVPREAFRIVPFPHSYPERLRYYAPTGALYLLSIYDDWGDAKLERFRALGYRTHVLWRRDEKVTTGSRIRALMRDGGDWERWVPPATAQVLRNSGIDERIRRSRVDGPLAGPARAAR
ncbi:MAG: adenylyltransferase/cytidyltransferase family protein [Isosphaeraceae bacterium]|nr:adenylyltransferase/cytidyltransferase family protein [Isosphaeraceae bacterium]